MATNVDWEEVLKDRYATFKVEENAYVDSLKICNSSEVAAEKIYEAIKDDDDIPDNLKMMYKEAVFGSDQRVKSRIKNRLSNIKRTRKIGKNPDLRKADMVHAADYANMSFNQLKNQLESSKKKDSTIGKAMQVLAENRKQKKKTMMDNDEHESDEYFWSDDNGNEEMKISVQPGFSKPSCISLAKKKMKRSASADDISGRQKKQEATMKSKAKSDNEFFNLKDGELVLSVSSSSEEDNGVADEIMADNAVDVNQKKVKKYSRASGQKMMAMAAKEGPSESKKSDDGDAKKPTKRKLSAEEAFDEVVKKRSFKNMDISFSLEDEADKINDLLTSFKGKPKKPAPKSKEDKILQQIEKCTKAVNNNIIEHTAYIRGSAAKNDIDLEKYKDEVRQEIENDNEPLKSDAETEQPTPADMGELFQNQMADPEIFWKQFRFENELSDEDNTLPDLPEVN